MKDSRQVTCTNRDGVSMTFTEKDVAPFILAAIDGIYEAKNNVYVSKNSMIDGAVYQGSTAEPRNIVLHLKDENHYQANRDMLNQLFKEREFGTLVFQEGDNPPRKIEYIVESMDSPGTYHSRMHQISLICPDPFFYDISDYDEKMASWVSDFVFPFASPSGVGFEFGHQTDERIKVIHNDYAEDDIGMTIIMTCTGAVTNPSVTRVESNETIYVGSDAKPFVLQSGDVLTITTATGNKHVKLTRANVTTEVNQYLTENSVFIQLMRGDNTIGYDAESGANNLSVDVRYRLKYARA